MAPRYWEDPARLEYSFRFAAAYDVVWWLRAENPKLLELDYGADGACIRCAGARYQVWPERSANRRMIGSNR
jgi:hypothetical protein